MRPRIRAGPVTSLDAVVPVEIVAEPSMLMMGNVMEFRHDGLRAREGERSRCDTRHDDGRGKRKR